MQKIFIRYFLVIMAITVSLTLAANFGLQTFFSQRKAEAEAQRMLLEISRRINDNEQQIKEIRANLNENYIARARAFAEMIDMNPAIVRDNNELNRIAKLLNVDELHVIDGDGFLRWGTVPKYYDMDFNSTDQTRPFLAGIEDKNFALAQDPQPNGNEGKLFQYIGVALQKETGVVEVGVVPEILDKAMENNQIQTVIAGYNVVEGINVIALNRQTGVVAGDSKSALVGREYRETGIEDDYFHQNKSSGWIKTDQGNQFAVFGQVSDYLMGITFTEQYLFNERRNQNITAAISSVLLGLTIIVAIFLLLKRMIIRDIEQVNLNLKQITQGNLLEVVLDVSSTPELVTLGSGINEMVGSLRRQMYEIEHQSADLEERNRDILASLQYAKKIQSNLLPSAKAFNETFPEYCVLWQPRDVVGGDIYWMKCFEEGALLCVCDCTGHGTPGALLTMIVVSAFEDIVREDNCQNTAHILWALEQRLVNIFGVHANEQTNRETFDINNGCDLAILFIAKNQTITLSAGKTHVFVCDGEQVKQIKGQKLFVGEGKIENESDVQTVVIPANPGNRFYIASDGLFDQVGGNPARPFGYQRFTQLILEHHDEKQTDISQRIWDAFEEYRGEQVRRDDVELISFRL